MYLRLLPYLAIATTTVGWALSPVFMRYMSAAYDPYTSAFLRYSSGLAVLLPFSLWTCRADLMRLLRRAHHFAGLGLVAMTMVTLWTHAHYLTTATTAILVSRIQVPFVIVLSLLLFHEERRIIRSPLYLGGTALGIGGVVLVVAAKSPASALPTHYSAVAVLILVAACWSLYTVWGKHLVLRTNAVPMFTVVLLFAVSGLAISMCLFGRPADIVSAGPRMALIAFVSGAVPVGISHCTFLHAQKHLGSAVSTSITLLSPLITHVAAWALWPDERLAPVQWAGAASLIFGSYLVVMAQRRRGETAGR